MRMRTIAAAAGLSAAFLGAGAILMAQGVRQTDGQLPPAPETMYKMIESRNVSLVDAIAIAEEHTGGLVQSISYRKPGEPNGSGINAVVYTPEAQRELEIDGFNGEVLTDEVVPRFPGWATDGEVQTTESGLMYIDLQEGDGAAPAGPSSVVRVHYTGYLTDGTKFDSSHDRGESVAFPLNRVISGWTEGVGSMKVGGRRKLIIPYQMAYGEAGRPPTIPPRAMLIFDVELLGIESE